MTPTPSPKVVRALALADRLAEAMQGDMSRQNPERRMLATVRAALAANNPNWACTSLRALWDLEVEAEQIAERQNDQRNVTVSKAYMAAVQGIADALTTAGTPCRVGR